MTSEVFYAGAVLPSIHRSYMVAVFRLKTSEHQCLQSTQS